LYGESETAVLRAKPWPKMWCKCGAERASGPPDSLASMAWGPEEREESTLAPCF